MTAVHRRRPFGIRILAILAMSVAAATIFAGGGSVPASLTPDARSLSVGARLPASSSGEVLAFDDQFDSPALDPAWQVVAYTGARVYGYPLPANDYSLTANPGHLRYTLSPMTYHTGYLNNFQPIPAWTYSCCPHDPGLELHRTFGGEDWLLASKVEYHAQIYTGSQSLQTIVYFGDGGPGTVSVHVTRWSDAGHDMFLIYVDRKIGPGLLDSERLTLFQYDLPGDASATLSHRLERAGSVLTATWSQDGVTWNPAFSYDMGTMLDGLGQRVVLAGLCWFDATDAYADYDYVTLADTRPLSITSLTVSPGVLWPPNHELVPIQVAVSTTDVGPGGPACFISGVASDEPVNGLGDGDSAPDWTTPVGLTVNLRAERAAGGGGRTYTLSVTCADPAGRVATGDVAVRVPKDQGKK